MALTHDRSEYVESTVESHPPLHFLHKPGLIMSRVLLSGTLFC